MDKLAQNDLDHILRLHTLWRACDPEGRRADFGGKDLRGLSFANIDCTNVRFVRANCANVCFIRANCIGADFTGANCASANFTNTWCSFKDVRHIGYMGNHDVYLHNTLNVVGVQAVHGKYIDLNPSNVFLTTH